MPGPSGGLQLPTLTQRVYVDDSQVGQAIAGIQGKLAGISSAATSAGLKLTAGLTLPIVGFGAVAVKESAKVESGLSEVVTLFGDTGDAAKATFDYLQSGLADLSNEVGIAQDVLTGGLYQAISAGVPKENAFEFLKVASKASIAGVTDVETAVDGLTTTLNAFGLDASQAGAVADSMFATVQGGKTTFEELSGYLFQVAPAAAAAGVSFQEVNAAIATLTAAGVPTAQASTQLRAALVGLQRPSAELDSIFQSLGYQNAQAALEAKGLGFALKAVSDASGGNNGKLTELLGSVEAVGAAQIIAGTGAEKFADELARQADAAGSVDDAFGTMDESTTRQWARLTVEVKNLAIEFGNLLLPILREIVPYVQSLTDWIKNLSPETKDLAIKIAGIAAAAGPVLLIIGKVAGAFSALAGIIGGIGLGPFVLLVGALAAAGYLVYSNWDKVGPIFDRVKDVVVDFFSFVKDLFTGDTAGAAMDLGRIFGWNDQETQVAWHMLENFRDRVVEILTGVWDWIQNDLGPALKSAWDSAWAFVEEWGPKIIDTFSTWFAFLRDEVAPRVAEIVSKIAEVLGPIFSELRDTYLPIAQDALSKLRDGFQGVVDWVSEHWPEIQETIVAIVDGIRSRVEPILGAIQGFWEEHGDAILNQIQVVWNTISGVISGVMETIGGIIETVMALIRGDWGDAWEGIQNVFSGVWNTILAVAYGAFETLKNFASDVIETVVGFFSGLGERIGGFASGLWEAASGLGKSILDGIVAGISGVVEFASGLVESLGNMLKNAWNSFVDLLNNVTPNDLTIGPVSLDLPDSPWDFLKLAGGGRYGRGQPIIVGEYGPEIQVPQAPGVVQPKSKVEEMIARAVQASGGGGGRSFQVQIDATDRASGDRMARDFAWGLKTVGVDLFDEPGVLTG